MSHSESLCLTQERLNNISISDPDGENIALQYTSLGPGEIRLLFSETQGAGVVWSLQVVQLISGPSNSSPISYDALSYTWGDLDRTYPFICNGKVMQIHHNLNEALPFLAKRASSLPIWIDALCINQSDDGEKKTQIRMMDKIYRNATQVWIWLGLGTDYTSTAIDVLPSLSKVKMKIQKNYHPHKLNRLSPDELGLPPLTDPVWEAVLDLIANPWFRRLWVLQEMALGQKIAFLCGKHEIDYNVLKKAVASSSSLTCVRDEKGRYIQLTEGDVYHAFYVRGIEQRPEGNPRPADPMRLMSLIHLTCGFHRCSEARDQILGLLGFLEEGNIVRDELLNTSSVATLYTKVTEYILTTVPPRYGGWWDLLNLAACNRKKEVMPSWVPDFHLVGPWQSVEQARRLRTWSYNLGRQYQASQVPNEVNVGPSPGQLILKGKLFDSIKTKHLEFPTAGQAETEFEWKSMLWYIEFFAWEQKLEELVLGRTPDFPPKLSLSTSESGSARDDSDLDSFWRTLIGDITDNNSGPPFTYTNFRNFRIGLNARASTFSKYRHPHR